MIGLADTSLFIAQENHRPTGADLPEDLAVSIITIGELRLGVLMATDLTARQRRLSTLQIAAALEPIPIDDRIAEEWAGMVARLRSEGRRMPLNDSWIAATALANGIPIVTHDDDFESVPGLQVIRV